jgi:HEAT repeat protein
MTTTCPACNKSVDSLRSRFVGVVNGKVVAYCSAACMPAARGAPIPAAAPAATPPAPAVLTGLPTPPAGISTLARTPATGVPVGSSGPGTSTPGMPIVVDSGPVIQILYEPVSGAVPGTPAEHTAPRATPAEPPTAASSSADQAPPGAVRPAVDPAARPAARPSPRGDAPSDKPATGGVAARSHTDRALPAAHDDAADHASAGVGPPRKRRAPLVLVLLVLIGVAGFVAYQYLRKHNLSAATSGSAPVAPAAAASSAEPPRPPAVEIAPAADRAATIDITASVAQARATLHAELTATSQRLQRIAAAALARTQDPAACDALAAQLGLAATARPGGAGSGSAGSGAPPAPARQPETSEIAKLDLAYSLARGGDKRGRDALAAALGSQRPDVRDEAARLLALLGDPRAVPHLTDLLAVSQRRLGAAEHLAHLAEPHAIKVLEALRGDPRTSADDKARATIALGIAGHADVAPALRDMLGDPHFNAFAAAALAELKDAAARPVLEHQLESPMLRVRAARALRRLDPSLDPKPLLPPLLSILKLGRDTDQVEAAELILLLAGPASWSAYD